MINNCTKFKESLSKIGESLRIAYDSCMVGKSVDEKLLMSVSDAYYKLVCLQNELLLRSKSCV